MADPIFSDNFETGNLALWDFTYKAEIVSGINGVYSADIKKNVGDTNTDAVLVKDITAISTIYLSLHINANSVSSGNGNIIAFYNGETILALLYAENDSTNTFNIYAYNGYFDDVIGYYGVSLNQGTTYGLAVKYTPHVTSGTFQVKLDGNLIIDQTSVPTAPSTLNVDSFHVGDINLYDDLGFSFVADDIIVNADDWATLPSILIESSYAVTMSEGLKLGSGYDNYYISSITSFTMEEVLELGNNIELGIIYPGVYEHTTYYNIYCGSYNIVEFVIPTEKYIYLFTTSDGLSLSSTNVFNFVDISVSYIYNVSTSNNLSLGSNSVVDFITLEGMLYTVETLNSLVLSSDWGAGLAAVFESDSTIYSLEQRGSLYLSDEIILNIVTPVINSFEMNNLIGVITIDGKISVGSVISPVESLVMQLGEIIASGVMGLASGITTITTVNDVYETWVLSNLQFDVSMYSNWNFNSYTMYDNQYYGAQSDGIYILEGADDDGDTFQPGVRLGPHDFGTNNYKRIRSVDTPGCSAGQLKVSDNIKTTTSTVEIYREKFVVPRSVQDKWLTLEIIDFDELGRIEISPVVLAKR
jgi:hypothetical protein